MRYLAVLLMVLAVVCYTGQGFFSKLFSVHYQGPEKSAAPVFAVIFGFFTAFVTLAYNRFAYQPSRLTLFLGILNGLVLFFYNLASIKAAQRGPYTFQSMMMIFGDILIMLLVSVFCWGDSLPKLKLIGIFVMLASFVIFNSKELNFEGCQKGYLFWVFMLFLINGVYGSVLDAQQRLSNQTERNEMIITTFVVSAVVSLIYLAFLSRRKLFSDFRMPKKALFSLLGSSLCAALAVNMLMATLALVPASVLYTVVKGSVLFLSALLSALVLKEKLKPHMIAGIAVGILSLILLSL